MFGGMEVAERLPVVLDRYVERWSQNDLDSPPLLFTMHWDVWGKPRGEMSTTEVDFGQAFAILAPFMVVPTISEAYLVADVSTLERRSLSITQMSIDARGMASNHWKARWWLGDSGQMAIGVPGEYRLTHPELRKAVTLAVTGRLEGHMLSDDWTFEHSVRAAISMLEKLDT